MEKNKNNKDSKKKVKVTNTAKGHNTKKEDKEINKMVNQVIKNKQEEIDMTEELVEDVIKNKKEKLHIDEEVSKTETMDLENAPEEVKAFFDNLDDIKQFTTDGKPLFSGKGLGALIPEEPDMDDKLNNKKIEEVEYAVVEDKKDKKNKFDKKDKDSINKAIDEVIKSKSDNKHSTELIIEKFKDMYKVNDDEIDELLSECLNKEEKAKFLKLGNKGTLSKSEIEFIRKTNNELLDVFMSDKSLVKRYLQSLGYHSATIDQVLDDSGYDDIKRIVIVKHYKDPVGKAFETVMTNMISDYATMEAPIEEDVEEIVYDIDRYHIKLNSVDGIEGSMVDILNKVFNRVPKELDIEKSFTPEIFASNFIQAYVLYSNYLDEVNEAHLVRYATHLICSNTVNKEDVKIKEFFKKNKFNQPEIKETSKSKKAS